MDFTWTMQAITNRILRSAVETFMLNGSRARLGYVNSVVAAGGYQWSYLEKHARSEHDDGERGVVDASTQPVVVFVHGFSSEKDSWMSVAKHVPSSARVLIPDLPGHGMTSPMLPSGDYRAMAQVRNLKSFLDATVGPDTPVHLVGCSMGGLISGVFAATYPHRLHSLTLICPAGVSMPRKSPVLKLYEDDGVNAMRGGTVDELTDMFQYIAYRPPGTAMEKPTGMRRMLLSVFANYRAERMPVMDKVLADMMADQTALESQLHKIQAKTVVLWGQNDQILDVSCLERMDALNAEKVVIPLCGHIVQQSYPDICAAYINRFLEDTPVEATAAMALA
ncbi:hypothetical protein H257_09042 [Aphanomyces astaci]|uniref:AB hydrolase-1 domain-containing protein n=1 Tax=Aphanomyces astaci TaxID=112090 RepID=W4GBV1_APHAT|nr:hypothetical protein H257_09042 [Aphanomyces astaci]ETV77152.1 hypothetical protein H257_09042 [Aphanomyces astaci]|eukprot:XP_009833458.1 hypothetical protein H257_09042 [Aphanomyces astaci]